MAFKRKMDKKIQVMTSKSDPSTRSESEVISNNIEQKKARKCANSNRKNNFRTKKSKTFIASNSKKVVEELNKEPQEIDDSATSNNECEVTSKLIRKEKPENFANINHKNSFGANNWAQFMASDSKSMVKKLTQKKDTNPKDLVRSKYPLLNRPKKHKDNLHVPTVIERDKQSKFRVTEHKLKSSNSQPPLDGGVSKLKSSTNLKLATHECTNNKERVLTKQIAMDCEMVGVEVGANNSMVARVSLVNGLGDCIYDKYVKPTEPILSYRTNVSGIRPKDLENATDFKTVQKEVADILKGRVLVGHALKNDLSVLFLTHPKRDIRDTSKFRKFREGRIPALKKLAKRYLGVSIQEGEHSSVQDALAAMQLYRMFRKEWEASLWSKKTGKLKTKAVNKPVSHLQLEV